jgi:hypothetical protein
MRTPGYRSTVSPQLNRSFELQPARIDYELATFHNDQANRQNDIRLSAGVLYRFGARNK